MPLPDRPLFRFAGDPAIDEARWSWLLDVLAAEFDEAMASTRDGRSETVSLIQVGPD